MNYQVSYMQLYKKKQKPYIISWFKISTLDKNYSTYIYFIVFNKTVRVVKEKRFAKECDPLK